MNMSITESTMVKLKLVAILIDKQLSNSSKIHLILIK